MKPRDLRKRIGTAVTVSEEMTIIHAKLLDTKPMTKAVVVDYLRGSSPEVLVQMTAYRGRPRVWNLLAVINGDFTGGQLAGFVQYAKTVANDAKHPVIALRRLVTENAAGIPLPKNKTIKREDQMVVHSKTKGRA